MSRIPISPRQRFQILSRDGFTCHYCGQKAPDVILHVDHVVPVAAGGSNLPSNLITSCSACNHGKAAGELLPETLGTAVPVWAEWACDACFVCADECWERGCYAVLPTAATASEPGWIVLAYRCACGHQWRTGWSPEFLRDAHVPGIHDEIRDHGLPTFPRESRWLQ